MDRDPKSAIKKLVLALRHLLQDDIEVVLKRYGIYTDHAWRPVEKIPKLTDAIRQDRARMEAAVLGLAATRDAAAAIGELLAFYREIIAGRISAPLPK